MEFDFNSERSESVCYREPTWRERLAEFGERVARKHDRFVSHCGFAVSPMIFFIGIAIVVVIADWKH